MVYYLLAGAGGWGGELQKQCLLGTTLSLLFQAQISCGYLHKPKQGLPATFSPCKGEGPMRPHPYLRDRVMDAGHRCHFLKYCSH